LVGGGGKTTAMFRLAREIVEKGEHALTTTTTRIFAAQIALAPSHIAATDATCESVWAALDAHRHLLVIGATDAATGRAGGVSLDMFRRLRAWCPRVCSAREARHTRDRVAGPGPPERRTQERTGRRPRRGSDQQGGDSRGPGTGARDGGASLLREPAIESVVLATVRGNEPVLEVCTR